MNDIVIEAINDCSNKIRNMRAFTNIGVNKGEYRKVLENQEWDNFDAANLPNDFKPPALHVRVEVYSKGEWWIIYSKDKNVFTRNKEIWKIYYECFENELKSEILKGINYGLTCI